MVTDVTAARTLFVRDCPVRATFSEWGEFVLMIGGHKKGAYEAKGREETTRCAHLVNRHDCSFAK